MSLLALQLSAAISHSTQLSEMKAEETERKEIAKAKRQQKASIRAAAAPNIKQVLLARLPKTEKAAIPLSAIETLFADYKTCPSGISSALTVLCKEKQVLRIGERRAYRYYVKS